MNSLNRFSKNPQISNFMKIRPVGSELHADGQTDMTKLIVAFRSFKPKNRRSKTLPCVIKHGAFEGVWGTAHMAPHMLDSDTLCSEKSASLPDRFLSSLASTATLWAEDYWRQLRSGRFGRGKNLSFLQVIEIVCLVVQPVFQSQCRGNGRVANGLVAFRPLTPTECCSYASVIMRFAVLRIAEELDSEVLVTFRRPFEQTLGP